MCQGDSLAGWLKRHQMLRRRLAIGKRLLRLSLTRRARIKTRTLKRQGSATPV